MTDHPEPRSAQWVRRISGILLLTACAELTLYSHQLPVGLREQVEGYLFHLAGGWFPAGILVLYVPYFAVLCLVHWFPSPWRTVLAVSVFARILLVPGVPILETDFYRYLWDGRMMTSGQNPFEFSPAEVQTALQGTDFLRDDPGDLSRVVDAVREEPLHREILNRINNPTVPTIYFPVAQVAFALTDAVIRCVIRSDPGDAEVDWKQEAIRAALVWKFILLFFEVGNLILILSILDLVGKDRSWVVVYGWSPMVLKEYSNTGHFDPIAIFFYLTGLRLLGGLILANSNDGRRIRRKVATGAALGTAAATKLFPVLFLGPLSKRLGWTGVSATVVTAALLFAPFMGVGTGVFKGFLTYSDRWEFNSSLPAFLEWGASQVQDFLRGEPISETTDAKSPLFTLSGVEFTLDAFFVAKALCGLLTVFVLGILTSQAWRESGPLEPREEYLKLLGSCYVLLGTLLLASPVTNPWYVGWIVPLLCIFPNKAWLFLTFSIQAYYLYFWNDWAYVVLSDLPWLGWGGDWEVIRPLEYAPFYALLIAGAWAGWRKKTSCR